MITSLYAGLFGLLYMQITFDVIRHRRRHKVSIGFGKNKEVSQIVSAHANFSSFVPFAIILLYLLETSMALPQFLLHIFGLSIFLGRVLHYVAFRGQMNFRLRLFGMVLTIFPLIAMSLLNVYAFIVR